MEYDVVVIGGGPAGSTAAALLAERGVNTLLVERDKFPRFHIGESLLPGNRRIMRRLGVEDEVCSRFVSKPGGKWFYGNSPIRAEFANATDASFASYPFAFMVERARFDEILLENAAKKGAHVWQQRQVVDVLGDNGRVTGVKVRDDSGQVASIPARMVVDCSGQRAMVATKLGQRRPNPLRRMAVYGHYEAELRDPDLKNGWFAGQLIKDGWVWYIPLGENKVSIGVVISVDRYAEANESPQAFLERVAVSSPYLRDAVSLDRRLTDQVRTIGNMGYSSRQLVGDGWILAGDAAFFVDPCYSTGVYLAMLSGEKAADSIAKALSNGGPVAANFQSYEAELRRHEKSVLNMVDGFYVANRSRVVRKLVPYIPKSLFLNRFTRFAGGDFNTYSTYLKTSVSIARVVCRMLP